MKILLALILLLPGWGRYPDYKSEREQGIPPTVSGEIELTIAEWKILYRQGFSECRGMGDARDDCVKGVTSVVLSRIALDRKMGGTWSLSDGTIWGTMSLYNGDFPQFTPWDWDENFCGGWPDHPLCAGKPDLSPFFAPVRAAVNGDGGSCAGYLFYGHERPPNLSEACKIEGGQQVMYFHNGWGWNDILKPGEWLLWHE